MLADGSFDGDGTGAGPLTNGPGPYYFSTRFNANYSQGYGKSGSGCVAPWPIQRTVDNGKYGQATRHNAGYNAAFIDGHVETLKTIDDRMVKPIP